MSSSSAPRSFVSTILRTNIFRTKSVEASIRDTDDPQRRLRKELTATDLVMFGLGVVLGTGIFVLTGVQAARNAGPAIVISFGLAAVVCALAAMCYAEFAATVPVAGSAYTFGYATLGEFVAWIIGWDLMLELALGAAVVARGWSAYLQNLFDLPTWFAGDTAQPDIAAMCAVATLSYLAIRGTKLSGRVTTVLVLVKVAAVLFVIGFGLFFIKSANLTPFIPPAESAAASEGWHAPLLQVISGITPQHFGWFGIIAASSIVFFAYIGFDIVATTAEETRNPQRNVPIGIIGSLAICAVLYMATAFVVTGMADYRTLDTGAPLAKAFDEVGQGWAANVISIGAVCGITTVMLLLLLGQARVFFAMARDGLLPTSLARVHSRYGTPWLVTTITGVVVATLAGFVPLAKLAELTSIGTLFAFVVVCVGVVVLRRTRPDLPRAFRVPASPWLPTLAVGACGWLMLNLPVDTWIRFGVWMALGVAIYFGWGYRKSRLNQPGP